MAYTILKLIRYLSSIQLLFWFRNNFNKSEEYGLQALEIGERILDPLDSYIATRILFYLGYIQIIKNILYPKIFFKSCPIRKQEKLSICRLTENSATNVENKNALYHIKNLAYLDSINHESLKFDSTKSFFISSVFK